jgi:hypothetical protein
MIRAAGLAFCILATALAAPATAQTAPEQAPASRQERLTSAASFVPQPTLSASVLLRHSARGTIVLDMGLDVPDAELRRRAQVNGPRIRDALRSALAVYANTYYRDRTAPDPADLTRLLQQATDRTLGAPGARVLLVNIIYQRSQG